MHAILLRSLILCAWLLFAGQAAWGQFGGGQPAANPAANQEPAAPPRKITNPLVEALLETKPGTPSELVRAINTLIDLKHAFVAKEYVNQLLAANLNEEQLASLAREFGTRTFLKLAVEKELQPEGKQLADAVLAAYSAQVRDPQRIAGLVEQLKSPSLGVRQQAVSELRKGGTASVVVLVGVLADPARAADHEAARAGLAALGNESIPPLLGALAAPDASLKVHLIDVLRRLRADEAIPYLLEPAHAEASPPELKAAAGQALVQLLGKPLDRREAASLLYTRAKTAYDQAALTDPTSHLTRELWHWNADTNQPAPRTHTVAAASLVVASRLSRDLYELMPDSPLVRRLYLGALLDSAAHEAGLDQPLPQGPGTAYEEAAAAGAAAIEDVLAESMRDGHLAAATAAAALLGDVGSVELLYNRGAKPAVLVEAAYHADRRLRFTAVDAILRLGPTRPYPGSSQVFDALSLFAGASGNPKALVLDTSISEARRLAGLLAEMGYEAEIAAEARAARQMLASSPDYELALIEFSFARANVDELVQQLRHDHRTAPIPIALVATAGEQLSANRIADRESLVGVIARPQDREGMEFQVQRLLARSPRPISAEERLAQTQKALAHLGAIASRRQALYDVQQAADEIERALYVPELSAVAAPILADMGTAAGQQALVGMASRASHAMATRQAAAEAFRRAVARYGILLSSDEIVAQYERYNQSEGESPESQALLGSILDTIESRTAAVQNTQAAEAEQPE